MALIHMDSFDSYASTQELGSVYGGALSNVQFSTSEGRFGGGAFKCDSTGDDVRFFLPNIITSGNRIWVAFAIKQNEDPTNDGRIITIYSDDGEDIVEIFAKDFSTVLELQDVDNSSLATFSLTTGVWNWMEIEAEYGSATGAIILRLNGTDIYNGTGNTDDPASTGFESIVFSASVAEEFIYDDLLIGDDSGTENNTIPGDTKIVALTPNGAGSSTQFTPNGAATNHEAVDEKPNDGDTSYNYSGSSGDRDTFSFADLAETPNVILGVNVRTTARKDDVGILSLRNVLTSGTTTETGSTRALTQFYQNNFSDLYENDPDTGSPWTEAGVNAIEAGYEIP